MNKYICQITFSFLLFFSCSQNKIKEAPVDSNIVSISIVTSSEEYQKQCKDMIASINYIELEESENSIIGLIQKILIEDEYLYIADRSSLRILKFDISGKYIQSIGMKGNGPGEYLDINDFCIDKNTIYVLNAQKKQIICYTKTGEYITTQKLPCQVDVINKTDNGWLLGLSSYNNMSYQDKQLIETDNHFELIKSHLPNDHSYDNNVVFTYYFTENGNKIVYNRIIDNKVYTIDNGTGELSSFQIDWGDYTLSLERTTDLKWFLEEKNIENFCFLLSPPILTEKNMYGLLNMNREIYSYIIDFDTKKSYINKYNRYFSHWIGYPTCIIGDSILVSYADSHNIEAFTSKDEMRDHRISKHLSGESNPTLILHKLKK